MENVSVVIAPRERYSSIINTIEDLMKSIPSEVPVYVVEGGTPAKVRAELEILVEKHGISWVSEENPIIPNKARNIGLQKVMTKYVALVDNDIVFEKDWLTNLVQRAESDNADVVAPLICIGPPRAKIIHHAGGFLQLIESDSNIPVVKESHRLMDVPLDQFSESEAPPSNEVGEFHCILVRRDLFDRIGPLDERLITREQMDFALRCKQAGAVVRFERNSVVTYSAKVNFSFSDLRYHLFRWSDKLTVKSLNTFEESWGVKLEQNRIRYKWIRNHRHRAISSTYPKLRKLPKIVNLVLLSLFEIVITPRVSNSSIDLIPPTPANTAVQLLTSEK